MGSFFGIFRFVSWFRIFGLGSLVWNLSFGIVRLGSFVEYRLFRSSLVWGLRFENFRLGLFVWDLSFSIFGLRFLV